MVKKPAKAPPKKPHRFEMRASDAFMIAVAELQRWPGGMHVPSAAHVIEQSVFNELARTRELKQKAKP